MKKFYTSNYVRSSAEVKAVAISRLADVPTAHVEKHDAELAPSHELVDQLLAGQLDSETFAEKYLELLGDRGFSPLLLADKFEDGTIFICYDFEDGNALCHRFVLARWLNEAGVAIVSEI